jgi:hypothetical protein
MEQAMAMGKAGTLRRDPTFNDGASEAAPEDVEPSMYGADALGLTSVFDSQHEDLDLRQNFVDSYGVDIEFPAYYSDNGMLVPHRAGFIVSSGFHVIPRGNKQRIQVNPYSEEEELPEFEWSKFSELYDRVGGSLILKLQETSGRSGFKTHRLTQLAGVRSCRYRFSPSGKFFALY